jgi:carbon-monoxide dehydrogenase large subunit
MLALIELTIRWRERVGSDPVSSHPRPFHGPIFFADTQSTPCRHNPLGVKGCGDTGTIASPATVMNAVVDALSQYRITHLDMPATPQRSWHAIHAERPAA